MNAEPVRSRGRCRIQGEYFAPDLSRSKSQSVRDLVCSASHVRKSLLDFGGDLRRKGDDTALLRSLRSRLAHRGGAQRLRAQRGAFRQRYAQPHHVHRRQHSGRRLSFYRVDANRLHVARHWPRRLALRPRPTRRSRTNRSDHDRGCEGSRHCESVGSESARHRAAAAARGDGRPHGVVEEGSRGLIWSCSESAGLQEIGTPKGVEWYYFCAAKPSQHCTAVST